jgi:YHS domain-containing protein
VDLASLWKNHHRSIVKKLPYKQMKKILTLALILSASSLFAAEESPAPKPFPASITTCLVSGEKLGEMGKPYVFVHEGQEVKLCCKSCTKDFKKDPEKYIAKIKEAAAAPEKK